MPAHDSVKIRMYRLDELGDCFLTTFTVGQKKSHLLIDCGSFRNSKMSIDRLGEIVAQIKEDLEGEALDVVVGTHQHNDHLSGFLHRKEDFETIGVRQVWLSWLDDPRDAKARRIGDDHANLRASLHAALRGMHAAMPARPDPKSARSREILEDMLGFFGASKAKGEPPEVPARAVKVLKSLGEKAPKYLRPGQVLDLPGIPAGHVRVHVLGPPRDDRALYRKDPRADESYDHSLANATRSAASFRRALAEHIGEGPRDHEHYPFSRRYRCAGDRGAEALTQVQARYGAPGSAWRKIDTDWMRQAETLALYLNDFTNNSSLVLAVELVKTGQVLLFAADAQTGNWASWEGIQWDQGHPGTASLLQRTLFYKVGHHASHNATLVQAFEKMGGDELCALIPVHKRDPNITKANGWKMPAKKLFARVIERTNGRVLQMDDVNPRTCDLKSPAVRGAWKKAGVKPKVTKNAVELELSI